MEDNFYITLPSNVKSFSDNKISNYKTQLHSRIILNDDYEVGLCEISYTYSWYNLKSKQEITLFYLEVHPDGSSTLRTKTEYLESGHFNDIDDLVKIVNEVIDIICSEFSFDNVNTPSIEHDSINHYITVKYGFKDGFRYFLKFSLDLCIVRN
jgi:hypothetical protein